MRPRGAEKTAFSLWLGLGVLPEQIRNYPADL
jgi:hypothetical protein